MKTNIKPALKSIRNDLENAVDKAWKLIHALDFDPVSGNSPHQWSTLAVQLNGLRQEIEEANTLVNKIIDTQPASGITYNPRTKRLRCLLSR